MITVEKYLEVSKVYDNAWNEADKELKKVVAGNLNEMGLVNDETKKSEAYVSAKKRYDFAFKMVRDFNKTVPNKIKRKASELRRKEKYGFAF